MKEIERKTKRKEKDLAYLFSISISVETIHNSLSNRFLGGANNEEPFVIDCDEDLAMCPFLGF